jgi:hypothetical protein
MFPAVLVLLLVSVPVLIVTILVFIIAGSIVPVNFSVTTYDTNICLQFIPTLVTLITA